MISMRKIERILNDLAGVSFIEWQMIAEKVDLQFERRRNRIELMMEDTDQIRAGIQIEYGNIIPMEEAR